MKQKLFLLLLAVLFLGPLFFLLLQSFSQEWNFPDLLPQVFSLRAWERVFLESPQLIRGLGSSLAYSLLVVVISLMLSLPAAKALAWGAFPGKDFMEAFFLVPALIPPITLVMGIHTLLIPFSFVDSPWAVAIVLSFFAYPYMLRALIAGYKTISPNLVLCANNLGASSWQVLWKIEAPLLIPSLVSGASVTFLVAFSDYLIVMLIGGGRVSSLPGTIVPYVQGSDFSMSSAMMLLFLLLPLLLFFLLDALVSRWSQKHRRVLS